MWRAGGMLMEGLGPLVNLGLELNEHQRANHLHKEGILQNLRIHEAETQALKEYHRVEVKQSNDQHARELLQAKVQHEENIDSDKRAAILGNIKSRRVVCCLCFLFNMYVWSKALLQAKIVVVVFYGKASHTWRKNLHR